jgi:hypothetical protein
MADQILQQKIYPWDGGQDSTRNPVLISPKDIVDSNNIVYTTYTTKRKRPGLSDAFSFRPSGNKKILGGVDFWRLGSQYVVYYDGQNLKAISPVNATIDIITGSTSLPVDEVVSFTAFQGLLIACFSGGTTLPQAWTQSGTMFDLQSIANGCPMGPFGRIFLNKFWIPDPLIPGRILHTNTSTANDFTGGDAGYIDLDVNDNDPDGITAIFPPLMGNLYISKRYSIYRISPVILSDGSLTFSVLKISDGVGCLSHNAAVSTEDAVFFPSERGFQMLESSNKLSAVDSSFLSKDIQPSWTSETNFKRTQYMNGVYDFGLNSVLWTFPSVGSNFSSDVWGLSLAAGKWYRWRNFGQNSIFSYSDRTNKKRVSVCGSSTGDFGKLDLNNTTDYGVPISCDVTTGIICPSGSPDDNYSFNYISPVFVPQQSGKFTLIFKVDGQVVDTLEYNMTDDTLGADTGVDFTLGQSVLGGTPQVKLVKQPTRGYGMFYQILISHEPTVQDENEGDVGFEILGVVVDVTPTTKSIGERIA